MYIKADGVVSHPLYIFLSIKKIKFGVNILYSYKEMQLYILNIII